MSAISFTADYFSKEDEERELNELTEDEKEAILDDKYGRQNTNNNNAGTNNNDNGDDDYEPLLNEDDISDELLNSFYRARERLPMEMSEDLWSAMIEDPEVVEVESDPVRFLRCEDYDPERAAYRQGEYWKLRYEIFKDDAVKPLTLNGAMKSVVSYMVQIPSFLRILPADGQGRTVICLDRTGMRFKDYDDLVLIKILWYVFHVAIKKPSAQRNGVVFLIINQSSSWDFASRSYLRMATNSVLCCFPVKIRCRHTCVSSLVATLIIPIIKYISGRHQRLRLQVHNALCGPKLLSELESFGLQRTNLPTSIGGGYDEKPAWIDECEYILKSQSKRRR